MVYCTGASCIQTATINMFSPNSRGLFCYVGDLQLENTPVVIKVLNQNRFFLWTHSKCLSPCHLIRFYNVLGVPAPNWSFFWAGKFSTQSSEAMVGILFRYRIAFGGGKSREIYTTVIFLLETNHRSDGLYNDVTSRGQSSPTTVFNRQQQL